MDFFSSVTSSVVNLSIHINRDANNYIVKLFRSGTRAEKRN